MKAFLLLGRLGDITTLLPVLKDEAEKTGQPTPLVCAASYASFLEGTSYVRPLVFQGDYSRAAEARAWAARQLTGHEFVDCSVYGQGVNVQRDMSSFDREIWRLSRTPLNFDTTPVVFDRRYLTRENDLVERVLGHLPLRNILLYAGAGHSSPFAESAQFLAALTARVEPEFTIIDISNVRAQRPFDLLGLYEHAAGLIATDSFPLHLAQAAPNLPVAALTCEGPTDWHRSAWRPNHIIRAHYGEALRRVDEIAKAVTSPRRRTIFFVTTQAANPDVPTKERLGRAHASRQNEFRAHGGWYTFGFIPQRDASSMRDKPMPFCRDLFQQAADALEHPSDVIVVCNADIGFSEGLTGRMLEAIDRHGCCFAHRWDFYGAALTRRQPRHEGDLKQAKWYPGSDFFACTKAWWENVAKPIFPDMVFGREAWDMIMRNLMKRCGTSDLHCAIWHERHQSFWEHNHRVPGNEHNRRLATQWLARYGGSWNDWQGPQKYRG